MARAREWWVTEQAAGSLDASAVVDVLSGSGLAVAGATIRRAVGMWYVNDEASNTNPLATWRYGLAVGTSASPSDVVTPGSNSADLLWHRYVGFTDTQPSGGGRVGIDDRSPHSSWDTGTQRVLASGETLWLVWSADSTADVVNARWWSRVLVLLPA